MFPFFFASRTGRACLTNYNEFSLAFSPIAIIAIPGPIFFSIFLILLSLFLALFSYTRSRLGIISSRKSIPFFGCTHIPLILYDLTLTFKSGCKHLTGYSTLNTTNIYFVMLIYSTPDSTGS